VGGEDHDREFRTFGLVDCHHPHAFAPLLDDRRFVDFSLLRFLLDTFDERPERGRTSK